MQLCDRTAHHRRFVDLRQANVHVENMRASLLLSDALAEDVIHIIFAQGLLET